MKFLDFYAPLYKNYSIVNENTDIINEGVDDPGAFKAILLMGGPGSGKSYMATQLFGIQPDTSFGAQGLKVINSDTAFEHLLKKNNIPLDLATYLQTISPEEQEKIVGDGPDSLRSKARRISEFQMKMARESGMGVLRDTTGKNVADVMQDIQELQDAGYDVSIVFVDTPLDVALARNNARERKLKESVVRDLHAQVHDALEKIKKQLPDDVLFFTVENGAGTDARKVLKTELGRAITAVVETPLKNERGKALVQQQAGTAVAKSTKRRLGKTPATPAQKQARQAKYEEILNMPIKNPETGRVIEVGTAIRAGQSHPAYRAAMALIKQHMAKQ
jgi:predicted kinase